jgi:hypothetical protein
MRQKADLTSYVARGTCAVQNEHISINDHDLRVLF